VPDLPAPVDGVTWRHPTEADAEALAEVYAAAYEVDGGYLMVADELRDELTSPDDDPAEDAVVAADDGGIVAFGFVHRPSGTATERPVYLWGMVHPEWRRRGIGTTLLGWLDARAAERVTGFDDGIPGVIRTDRYDWQADRVPLFEGRGYRPVRYFFEMLASLTGPPPERPAPDGIEVRPWSDESEAASLRVRNEAFADHWGSVPRAPESWSHVFRQFFLPEASFVAYDGEVPVAYAICFMYPHDFESRGRSEAWVEGLGTVQSHRGRGIASALVARAMGVFREKGLEFAALAVDAENPSGALGLYERLGFSTEKTSITYQRSA
jgi:mycothiol synthase